MSRLQHFYSPSVRGFLGRPARRWALLAHAYSTHEGAEKVEGKTFSSSQVERAKLQQWRGQVKREEPPPHSVR